MAAAAPSTVAATSPKDEAASPAARASAVATAPPGRLLFRRFTDADATSGSLFTVTTDGRHEVRILRPTAGVVDQQQSWSRDGSFIVFARFTTISPSSEAHRLFRVAPDGSGLKALTAGKSSTATSVPGFDDSPAISPDGRRIAYVHAGGPVKNGELQHSDLFVMNADGSGAHTITHYADYSGDSGGIAWSPDGTRLVAGRYDVAKGGTALFVMGADGSGSRQLTPWTLDAGGTPDWAARGDLIAFRAVTEEDGGIGNFFTVHVDGTGLRQVTRFTDMKISHSVAFSPDGRWLAFAAAPAGGPNDIALEKVDGTNFRWVDRTPVEESGPTWGPAQ